MSKKNTTQQHEVRQEVNQVLADVVAWSLSCAGQGIYPARGFYGEPFEANTFRSTLCNKQIAGGFKLLEKKKIIFGFDISCVSVGLFFIQSQTKCVIVTFSQLKVALHDFQGRLESPMAMPQVGQLLPLQKVL